MILLYVALISSSILLFYTITQAYLALLYSRARSKTDPDHNSPVPDQPEKWPSVLVQLPIYNEPLVVERLLRAVSKFDYSLHLLTIQVLDDSNDNTPDIVDTVVRELANTGLNIKHIRRGNRDGYKAGALRHGMQQDSSEFIAIFDADFIPDPDFIKKTVAYFQLPDVGLVQTRWLHLNADESLLTKLLAFAIDGHFSVEQGGRQAGGYFTNFNGTAGILRRQAVEDAGGWQDDCLTEDLDLSFRLQLKGWRIRFVEEISTPSELPGNMSAIKSQQFRWTKGACETARKNLYDLWKSDNSLMTRFVGSMHMLNSCAFFLMFVMSVCAIPLILLTTSADAPILIPIMATQAGGLLCMVLVYWVSNVRSLAEYRTSSLWTILSRSVLLSLMQIGISMGNAGAVVQGLVGYRTEFVRTPKFHGDSHKLNERYEMKFIRESVTWRLCAEGLFFCLLLASTVAGLLMQNYLLLPYAIFITLSYGMVLAWSLKEVVNAVRYSPAS